MRPKIPIQAVYTQCPYSGYCMTTTDSSLCNLRCIFLATTIYNVLLWPQGNELFTHHIPRECPLPTTALSTTAIGLCVALALFRLNWWLLTLSQSCCFCSEVSKTPAFPICPSSRSILLSSRPAPSRWRCPLTSLITKAETNSTPLIKTMQNKKPTRWTFLLLMLTGKEILIRGVWRVRMWMEICESLQET